MGKLRYNDVKGKAREFLALTSLTVDEFETLVPGFEETFQAYMAQWRLDGKPRRQRRYTTYQNCPLPTAEDRLLFALSYLKANPIQSHHGRLFGMVQGKTNAWLHVLLPVLRQSLGTLGVAPSRSMSELAQQLNVEWSEANALAATPDAPLPLFVTMARNGESNVPKIRLNRARAIAARKKDTP